MMTGIRGAPLNARSRRRRRRGGRASSGDRLHRRDISEDVEALIGRPPRRSLTGAFLLQRSALQLAGQNLPNPSETRNELASEELEIGGSNQPVNEALRSIGLGCAIRPTGNTVWLEMRFGILEIRARARHWSLARAQRSFVTHSGFTTRREKRREALWLNQLTGGCQVTFAFSKGFSSGRTGALAAATGGHALTHSRDRSTKRSNLESAGRNVGDVGRGMPRAVRPGGPRAPR